MKQRVGLFIRIFIYFVLVFFLEKLVFMLVNASQAGGVSFRNVFEVLYHGCPLDLSMSGYLTIVPALVLIASEWVKPTIIAKIYAVYYFVVLLLIAVIVVADVMLYPYWGFHFDDTVFLYLQQPKEAMASAPAGQIMLGILGIAAFTYITYAGYRYTIKKRVLKLRRPRLLLATPVVLLVLIGALFLPIRGGVTVSTMNIGKVYFSDNLFLNHAAINQPFNLLYALTKPNNFAAEYQFYPKEKAEGLFAQLQAQPAADTTPGYLNTRRPNILFIILESFGAGAIADSLVAPNMHALAKEGIAFTNFYANSYRTDRGLVAALSGYPSQPTAAIMKYPQKTGTLPAIPKSLKQGGYHDVAFYYGGDADFSNMRSYIVGACGIKEVISDSHFPLSYRMTKWGVPDEFVFDRLYRDITERAPAEPYAKFVLTLSSHEPFDMPVRKFDSPFLNSIHYTDSCVGALVGRLKQSGAWDNMYIILTADHGAAYPPGLPNNDARRFHIPMLWLGGAVSQPAAITGYASQNDIAATLLSQLALPAGEFTFSKNVLNPGAHPFAFYSYVNGFTLIDEAGRLTYDNDKQAVIDTTGHTAGKEEQAKAFFQMMYLDLGNR